MSAADGTPDAEVPTPAVREYFGLAWAPVEHFAQMLVEEGELRGLIGPRELPRLWSRHLVNSAAVAPFLDQRAAVADVGSGAGFPGIVLAAVRPDLEMHLIEPMERRIAWLADVVEELGLDNVMLHHARAEELHKRASFDHVTARAVAAMDKLARWTLPLVRRGGTLVALKGQRAGEEVESAKYVLKKLGVVSTEIYDVQPVDGIEATTVVVARKRA
ncbi:16S rRNA (guanine(527)-N(7))-methyltransferase RsmG [Georgenia thermotolerans]|uniref:Ribosomal RNA small subunit methyltransferase G n=1 Tax=Georgenia thermotolerans TaxID=527326 RepID=A0A7J5UMF6_9MICO|nr:16S rRNA (guanine(527)-N(7))-methyltransferase RsmG [Georgenia thermotolerans]KAE8763559.1 16S rRNA (guanine(527)-N(7))-methyltransferase RsmG [Georgenia thermotolerans]